MAAPKEMLQLSLFLPLPSPRLALMALRALQPDLAPPPALATPPGRARPSPTATARGESLELQWEAPLARALRGGASTFLELLGLVLETIESFGPAPPPSEATPTAEATPLDGPSPAPV